MIIEEQALIDQARLGDVPAFEELLRGYEQIAYRLAYRLMGNEADASDATQDAFIKVYQHLGHFRGESAFSTWLFRIVSNTCLDHLRRRRKLLSRFESFTFDGRCQEPEWRSSPDMAEATVNRLQAHQDVHRALQELPAELRLLMVLRDLQGLKCDEIAALTGTKLGTVKTRLRRARLTLRALLQRNHAVAV